MASSDLSDSLALRVFALTTLGIAGFIAIVVLFIL